MPRNTKLHVKGKSTSIQKPLIKEQNDGPQLDNVENTKKFELELCWCIQQLEKALNQKKLPEKQLQESWKVLTVLRNNNQPVVRKRQLMRTHFGDYRAKMTEEEKKLIKLTKGIKICDKPAPAKATFIRKSAFQVTGDDSFRFNFENPTGTADEVKIQQRDDNLTDAKVNDIIKVEDKPFVFKMSTSMFKFNFDINNDK